MSELENRYRRLLRWYPVDHRRMHEEEMLGVLLAAGPERTRPSLRDALDLVRGGVGIRMRRIPPALADAGWRDAAALLSVIAPLILLTETVRYATEAGGLGGLLSPHHDYAGGAAASIILGLVTLAASLAGPGAARGRELLGRGGLVGILVLLAVSVPVSSRVLGARLGVNWGDRQMFVVIAALVAGGLLARTAAGRRAVVVLAAPLYAIVAPLYPGRLEDPLARILITTVVVPLSVAVVTALERLVVRFLADRDRAAG